MRHPKNTQNVLNWIAAKQPGYKFVARDIAKDVNLTVDTVGRILRWQDNVKKSGRMTGSNTTVWEKTGVPV